MDANLLKLIAKDRKPFTKELVEGFCYKDMEDLLEYYEKCLKNILYPLESMGLFFDGLERASPVEMYNAITKRHIKKSSYGEFESSKNSFFGIKVKTHFIDPVTKEKTILKTPYMFLPYTNKYGDVYVRGVLYSLQMVLSEIAPSVDDYKNKSLFFRVLTFKGKILSEPFEVKRIEVHSPINIKRRSCTLRLPGSWFYHPKNHMDDAKKDKTPLPLLSWYVFAKHGFDKAMKMYTGSEYVIDTAEVLIEKCADFYEWEIIENLNEKHKKAFYKENASLDYAIAVKTGGAYETTSLDFQYAAALLFASAVLGDKFDMARINEPDYWKLIIGYCSVNQPIEKINESFVLKQMTDHLVSVEEYADPFTLAQYGKSDSSIRNTYDLFNYLTLNYIEIIKTSKPADLTNKRLECKTFLIEHLIKYANEFKFRLRSKATITVRTIQSELYSTFGAFSVDRSIRENNTILEQTGTDNPLADYGLGIIRQTKPTVSTMTGNKKDDFNVNHPSGKIHPSQGFVSRYWSPSDPHPAGDGALSPKAYLVNGRYTGISPADLEAYEATKKRLNKN